MIRRLTSHPGAPAAWAEDDRGATAVEYALMLGLIALFIVSAVSALGVSLASFFESVASAPPFH